MMPRLLAFWDRIWTSLWFLPLIMVAAAAVSALTALNIKVSLGDDPVWFLYSGSAEEAPQFLSNLVSAMITMATLAISITMVVLTLAAQQLGPRLIGSFIGDRRTQFMLGLLVSTVVYLLLVLRSSYGIGSSTPNLAVTVGTLLVLICVVSLLVFVHHLARSIIADNIIDRVGAQLDHSIMSMLPDKETEQPDRPAEKAGEPITLAYGGYLQAIDTQAIVAAAAEANACVTLTIRPGLHAVPGSILGYVSPKSACEKITPAVQNAMVVGRERTAVQDLEFSIHQLVEVALRALSPGINDPYTAIAALDRLTLSLAKCMKRGEAKSVWTDNDDKVRLVAPVSNFEGLTDAAFNQIRQLASGMPAVLIRMAENIGQLLQQAGERHRPALRRHLDLVVKTGRRTIEEKDDRKDLEASARLAKKDTGKTEE